MNFSSVRVYPFQCVDQRLADAFARLVPQLSAIMAVPDRQRLEQIIASPNVRMFYAEVEGQVVGVLSLGWYDVPSGRRGWIEDVVVEQRFREHGVGSALVRAALDVARQEAFDTISLTSHASREAAHALYRKEGFAHYDTTLFRLKMNL